MKQKTESNQFLQIWSKLPVVVRAILTGFLVSTAGVVVWSLFLLFIRPPWSIIPMTIVLWVFWNIFSGRWTSGESSEIRKSNFRATALTPFIWKSGLIGALSFVIVIQASFVITFRIIPFPATRFTSDYKILDTMPSWIAWATLTASAVVAAICEEAGYRGYLQVPLERRYGPAVAILISSVIFTTIHLSKSWAIPIIPHIFFASVLLGILAYRSGSLIPGIIGHSILDIFNYSVWWTGLTGGFKQQTIFKTGVDFPFIVWTMIFFISLLLYYWAIRSMKNPQRS